jgi:surfeit locus 1 family protein
VGDTRSKLLAPTLTTLVLFAVLIGLGTWQVQRLYWKESLIAQRKAGLEAFPADPPSDLGATQGLEFHTIRAVGIFLNEREFLVHGIERDSGEPGFLVVTPLVLPDGAILLVQRGWVPLDRKAPDTRAAGELAGTVTVEGLLRLSTAKQSMFVPDNQPAANEWYRIDIAAMAQALGPASGAVLPYYISALATPNPGGYPVGGQTITDLPNDHLQYALTWYSLALALVVVYAVYVVRTKRA